MTIRSIKTLLKSNTLTGAEVGRLAIASLFNDLKHIQEGGSFKPLFSQEEFNRMTKALKGHDLEVYNTFIEIHNTIVKTRNTSQAYFQQFYNGYYRIWLQLENAREKDVEEDVLKDFPYIMTQQQYEKELAAAQAKLNANTESFKSLTFLLLEMALDYYSEGSEEELPEAVLNILEAYKKEPATNQRALKLYERYTHRGYYELPDGSRSDKLTAAEWDKKMEEATLEHWHRKGIGENKDVYQEFIQTLAQSRTSKRWELYFKGADAIRAAYKEATGSPFPKATSEDILEALYNYYEPAIGEQSQDKVTLAIGKIFSYYKLGLNEELATWHEYTKPTKGSAQPSKFDLLYYNYGALYKGTSEGASERQEFKEFKEDYPELFTFLENDIKENVPAAKELHANQYFKKFITWEELAKLDIYGYKTYATADHENIAEAWEEEGKGSYYDRKRIRSAGIATIQSPEDAAKAEAYKEKPPRLVVMNGLKWLSEYPDEGAKEIEPLYEKLAKPALRYLYASNALIDILCEVYGIEGGEVAKSQLNDFEMQLEAYNQVLYMFYWHVKGDKEAQAKKRAIIKRFFKPINIEELKPTEEAIEQIKQELIKLGYTAATRARLKDFESIIAELTPGKGADIWTK